MSISISRSHTKYNTYKSPKIEEKKKQPDIGKFVSPKLKIRADANEEPIKEIDEDIVDVIWSKSKPYAEDVNSRTTVNYIGEFRSAPAYKPENDQIIPPEPVIVSAVQVGSEVKLSSNYALKKYKPAQRNAVPVNPARLQRFIEARNRIKERIDTGLVSGLIVRSQELVALANQDKKISELQLATDLNASDLIAVVDRSDFSMASSGTTKAAQLSLLVSYLTDIIDSLVSYSNATPVPETIGGILAGTTFANYSIQEMFDALLYPYQEPSFTSFSIAAQSTNLEVGETIAGVKTFIWNTNNPSSIDTNSIKIRDVNAALDLAIGLANDGSESITLPSTVQLLSPGSYIWRIIGEDTQSNTFQRNFAVNWSWRRYYGTSNSTTLNETGIESLASSGLAGGLSGNLSYAAGGYKYYCFPTSFGAISDVQDTETGLPIAMASSIDDGFYNNTENDISYGLVSVTNTFGQTTVYKVYRTKYILGSTITFSVS